MNLTLQELPTFLLCQRRYVMTSYTPLMTNLSQNTGTDSSNVLLAKPCTAFTAALTEDLTKLRHTHDRKTTANHPQTNGLTKTKQDHRRHDFQVC